MPPEVTSSAGLRIEHACPQCGAPIALEETDRLINCEYCRVKSYLVGTDVFRYVLPHVTRDRKLVYFPYWRFRGVLYGCVRSGLEYRIVDASVRGADERHFPVSLGLRPQTLTLRFATPEVAGDFVVPTLSARAVTADLTHRFGEEFTQPVFHQEFIGETLSLIYAPFYCDDRLHDAVLDRPMSDKLDSEFIRSLPAREPASWDVRFVPTLCPHCGWDLKGERDSLLLICHNCHLAWRSAAGGLEQAEFACLPAYHGAAVYLPYWRVSAQVTGLRLDSYADFVQVANLPKVVQDGWESRRFHFWVPAFKVRPQVFLRIARAVTVAQPAEQLGHELPALPCHPVNLPRAEVVQSLKLLLAALLSPPAAFMPRLPGIAVSPQEMVLVFVPFAERRTELVHPHLQLAVNRNTLRHGLLL